MRPVNGCVCYREVSCKGQCQLGPKNDVRREVYSEWLLKQTNKKFLNGHMKFTIRFYILQQKEFNM